MPICCHFFSLFATPQRRYYASALLFRRDAAATTLMPDADAASIAAIVAIAARAPRHYVFDALLLRYAELITPLMLPLCLCRYADACAHMLHDAAY